VINTFGYRFTTLELNPPSDVHVPPRAV